MQEQRQANDEQQVEMVDPEEEETDASAPWARRLGENERWYGRFTLYRLLGSRRSLQRAYELARVLEGLRGQSPGQAWEQKASEFAWPERAEAWDADERRRWVAEVEARRLDARLRRLAMISELQEDAFLALLKAKLPDLEQAQIRALLSPLRLVKKSEQGMRSMLKVRQLFVLNGTGRRQILLYVRTGIVLRTECPFGMTRFDAHGEGGGCATRGYGLAQRRLKSTPAMGSVLTHTDAEDRTIRKFSDYVCLGI